MIRLPSALTLGRARRAALLGAVVLLGLGMITVALPLGGVSKAGAGTVSLAMMALVLVLAAAAGYIGAGFGALMFTAVVGLLGPYLAKTIGPGSG